MVSTDGKPLDDGQNIIVLEQMQRTHGDNIAADSVAFSKSGNLLSSTSMKKFQMPIPSQYRRQLAPKIKGGAISQSKRKTDWPVASELRI